MAHYDFQMTIASAMQDAGEKCVATGRFNPRWCGFANADEFRKLRANGYSAEAVEAMRAATAELAQAGYRNESQPATVGAWDVPSVISGLPICAVTRVKVPAAPLTVRVNLSPNSHVLASQIANQTARLALAVRKEILKGRVIVLEICSSYQVFSSHGCFAAGDTILQTLTADPARDDELATALSIQFLRSTMFYCNGINPTKTTGRPMYGYVNFGDDEARMMRELSAILAA